MFAESIRFGRELRAVRLRDFKLIHYPVGDYRLHYDLRKDPLELRSQREDPTGGTLSSALADYAARADSGWHLKAVSREGEPLDLVAEITTTGRLMRVRRYFSEHITGPSRFEFLRFEADPGGQSLRFELEIVGRLGAAGVFAGAGEVLPNGKRITLERDDPRLHGVLESYEESEPGLYIRAVPSRRASAPATDLPDDVLERLRSLGYVDAGK